MYKFLISGFADEIDANFDKQMQHLTALGMKYFEIRGVDGKNVMTLTDEQVDEVKRKIDKLGISVSSVGSPVGKDSIEEDFDAQLQRFKKIVNTAKKLQTKYIRIFSYFMKDDRERELYKDEVIKRLTEFVKIAEDENIILLHENEKDIFGESDVYCKYLFDNIKSDNFKAVFDPANFVQCGVETKGAFELLKDHIEYMHIKDALRDGTIVPAGEGVGNIAHILKCLKESGYKGFLSLEPHLGEFVGFADLEGEGGTKMTESSSADKFTLAFEALNRII
ncbi:MAG: sugar phosphate isomerase/epimerase [Clostridia bacterium]|nr:sugar phosphate isomerase/epimerase [Clostridia bacterium]